MDKHDRKVFGIGLSKTGTTSVARALKILGYRTKDYIGVTRFVPGDLSCVDEQALQEHDAFTDTPIPSFYRELDRTYPNARFILSLRDMDDWLLSCRKQFNENHAREQGEAGNAVFLDLYGCASFDEAKFRAGYARFAEGVREHFAERPECLLEIDVCAGEGWEKLCPFLGVAVPKAPFPVTNVTKIQWLDIDAIVGIARLAGREIQEALGAVAEENTAQNYLARAGRRLGRAVRLLWAGGETRKATCRTVEHLICGRLTALNPSIPIISPARCDVPYDVRRSWPHFWLVDPISGDGDRITVSIALVEGDQPLFGVVHAPLRDVVYRAKGLSGSFKIQGSGPAERLPSQQAVESMEATHAGGGPFALCMVADRSLTTWSNGDRCPEWQTAAAHAVLSQAGRGLYRVESGAEVRYNTPKLESGPCVAR